MAGKECSTETNSPHAIWYFSGEMQQYMLYDPTKKGPDQEWKSTFYPTEVVHLLEMERDALKVELAKERAKRVEVGESSRRKRKKPRKNPVMPLRDNQKKCQFCGKTNHTKNHCWKKAHRCFRCGSIDHHVKDCPLTT